MKILNIKIINVILTQRPDEYDKITLLIYYYLQTTGMCRL